MPGPHLRVALLGGVPALLGGGGLELQLQRTGAALRALGHDARPIAEWASGDEVDVVHAFNHGGDVVHFVEHWRRAPAAFVFSPVLVVAPSHEWRTRVGRHVPIPAFPARAIRDLVRKADITVGLTRWEADLMAGLAGVPAERTAVVSNGVDPVELASDRPWRDALAARAGGQGRPTDLPSSDAPGGGSASPAGPIDAGDPSQPGFVLSVGAVSPRKGQATVAGQLAAAGQRPYVVIGGADAGTAPDEIDRQIGATGGAWLREIADPAVVRGAMAEAEALIQFSEREGQSLAVLEALSVGTPVVGSDLPSHRELAATYPGWVEIATGPADLERAIATVIATSGSAPKPVVPTWAAVARDLEAVYRRALERPARTGQQR